MLVNRLLILIAHQTLILKPLLYRILCDMRRCFVVVQQVQFFYFEGKKSVNIAILWSRSGCMERKLSEHILWTYIHTYIIDHYNPSDRIIDLVSYTTYVVCVNFIHKWRALQFKVDTERQIFWETFHGNFIYSQSVCQKSAEKIVEEILFAFCFDVWPGAGTLAFTSNKPTHYLLDYSDFILNLWRINATP